MWIPLPKKRTMEHSKTIPDVTLYFFNLFNCNLAVREGQSGYRSFGRMSVFLYFDYINLHGVENNSTVLHVQS